MIELQTIKVRHNVEMAHRLFLTPGKCENIHGHSWLVTLELKGRMNPNGLLEGLDFGLVKSMFRTYLDDNFDHRVLLNLSDPWAKDMDPDQHYDPTLKPKVLPGLQTMNGDPTTENFAANVGFWAQGNFYQMQAIGVSVWETRVNNATWSWNAAVA